MAHAMIKATLIPEIVRMIVEKFHISEEDAMEQFYTSRTAEALSDSETGLYGQSALFIFGLFCQEKSFSDTIPKPPADIDALQLTETQLHAKLQQGYDDYKDGRTHNAEEAL